MIRERLRNATKRNRIFKILNLSLNLTIIIFLIGLTIYYFATNNSNRQYACLGIIGFSLIPLIFEFCSKKGIPNYLYLFVNIYIIFAGVWGSALNGYTTYWWFDIVIHSFMGYFAAVVGLFFLCLMEDHHLMKIFTVAVFCLSFSLLVEGVWELFEFGVDLIIPTMEMQGVNFADQNFPLVTDTMVDIFCNFIGAFVFFIHYLVAKSSRKNLGIDSMIREFTREERLLK